MGILLPSQVWVEVIYGNNCQIMFGINRAVTEAFGKVKTFCQRYLKQGRTVDNNILERIVKSITYVKVQDKDEEKDVNLYTCKESGVNHVVYKFITITGIAPNTIETITWKDVETDSIVIPDATPEPKMVDTDEIDTIDYESILLELFIPNFNVSVTDDLKSSIHKYVVDWIMYRFLQDQLADKAAEYKALAEDEDHRSITKDLNARESFNFRKPSWGPRTAHDA